MPGGTPWEGQVHMQPCGRNGWGSGGLGGMVHVGRWEKFLVGAETVGGMPSQGSSGALFATAYSAPAK